MRAVLYNSYIATVAARRSKNRRELIGSNSKGGLIVGIGLGGSLMYLFDQARGGGTAELRTTRQDGLRAG